MSPTVRGEAYDPSLVCRRRRRRRRRRDATLMQEEEKRVGAGWGGDAVL